jgi:hypothetical protein
MSRLRGAYIQSRGIRRPSSVSTARFVTAGAINLKLCTYIPLAKSNSQIKFGSSLILGLATRGPKPKTQKVLTPELMAWSSQNFYLIRVHYIIPGFLTYFWRSQSRGQSSRRHQYFHVSLSTKFRPDGTSKYCHQIVLLGNILLNLFS